MAADAKINHVQTRVDDHSCSGRRGVTARVCGWVCVLLCDSVQTERQLAQEEAPVFCLKRQYVFFLFLPLEGAWKLKQKGFTHSHSSRVRQRTPSANAKPKIVF